MLSVFGTYHYLAFCCLLSGLAILATVILPSGRKLLVLSGLLCFPYGIFSFEFIPSYWNPVVSYYYIASPEDLIFSGATGVLVVFFACFPYKNRISIPMITFKKIVLFLGFTLLGYGIGKTIAWLSGGRIPQIAGTAMSILMVAMLFTFIRKDMVRFSVFGCIGFTVLYSVILFFIKTTMPGFFHSWSKDMPFSYFISGIPVWEFIWALAYGYCWPLYMSIILGIKILPVKADQFQQAGLSQ